MVGPTEPGAVAQKAERRTLAVEKTQAAEGFQQHYQLLALKPLDHFHQWFRRLLPSLTAQKEKDCSAMPVKTLPATQRELSPFFHWVARICEVHCLYIKVPCYAYRPPPGAGGRVRKGYLHAMQSETKRWLAFAGRAMSPLPNLLSCHG